LVANAQVVEYNQFRFLVSTITVTIPMMNYSRLGRETLLAIILATVGCAREPAAEVKEHNSPTTTNTTNKDGLSPVKETIKPKLIFEVTLPGRILPGEAVAIAYAFETDAAPGFKSEVKVGVGAVGGKEHLFTIPGDQCGHRQFAFSPDGTMLASLHGYPSMLFLNEAVTGKLLAKFPLPPDFGFCFYRFSPDSRLVATLTHYEFKVWSIDKKALLFEMKLEPNRIINPHPYGSFAFTSDSKSVVLLSAAECHICTVDPPLGIKSPTIFKTKRGPGLLSEDGKTMVWVTEADALMMAEPEGADRTVIEKFDRERRLLTVSFDGRLLIASRSHGVVRNDKIATEVELQFIDLQNGKTLYTLRNSLFDVHLSRDSKRLLLSGGSKLQVNDLPH
jgi:hypothetical protein